MSKQTAVMLDYSRRYRMRSVRGELCRKCPALYTFLQATPENMGMRGPYSRQAVSGQSAAPIAPKRTVYMHTLPTQIIHFTAAKKCLLVTPETVKNEKNDLHSCHDTREAKNGDDQLVFQTRQLSMTSFRMSDSRGQKLQAAGRKPSTQPNERPIESTNNPT